MDAQPKVRTARLHIDSLWIDQQRMSRCYRARFETNSTMDEMMACRNTALPPFPGSPNHHPFWYALHRREAADPFQPTKGKPRESHHHPWRFHLPFYTTVRPEMHQERRRAVKSGFEEPTWRDDCRKSR